MSEEPEESYELEVPFLCVTSVGGPYDDESFVAGFDLGVIDQWLTQNQGCGAELTKMIRPPLAEQIDLIAMKHGWLTEYTPTNDENWLSIRLFQRVVNL